MAVWTLGVLIHGLLEHFGAQIGAANYDYCHYQTI